MGFSMSNFHLRIAVGAGGEATVEPTLTTPDSNCIKLQYYYFKKIQGGGWVGDPPPQWEGGGGLHCEFFLARTLTIQIFSLYSCGYSGQSTRGKSQYGLEPTSLH